MGVRQREHIAHKKTVTFSFFLFNINILKTNSLAIFPSDYFRPILHCVVLIAFFRLLVKFCQTFVNDCWLGEDVKLLKTAG